MSADLKHTPGPWVAGPQSTFDEGLSRVRCGHETHPAIAEIADRPSGGSWSSPEAIQERDANARLIAAAPELLAALTDALEALAMCQPQTGHGARCQSDAMLKARAAIAKAGA